MNNSLRKKGVLHVERLLLSAFLLAPAGAQALHTGGNIDMRDAEGTLVTSSGKPYSPKMTCGSTLSSCHIGGTGGHNYESNISFSIKNQVRRDGTIASYTVPFPEHGISAGYHFQQGRNIDWGNDQRNYYKLPNFTSSAGMYGKY